MRTAPALAAVLGLVAAAATATAIVSARTEPAPRGLDPLAVPSHVGPTFQSIGPLAFSPEGVLYAADKQAAAIHALDLTAAASPAPGTKGIDGIDQQIAAMLGTAASDLAITDLAVHPKTRNTYLSVMRGQGPSAQSALLRVDGAGTLSLVALDAVTFTSVSLPNPPAVDGRNRTSAITDMAYMNGRLFVAGLSNEEFSSKLWSVPYPFRQMDTGTSVEIFHGNHGRLETNSPVYSFVPTTVDGKPSLIAGYTCTPLVRFPVDDLRPGAKVMGKTIAELGNRSRPIDMILYRKDGREFLLIANTTRGVMKLDTSTFDGAGAITAPVTAETGGVPFEPVPSMTGVEQLDLLDATHTVVLSRTGAALNLQAVILP
ncbi:MAG: hypothetical protein R2752_09260 [Vicinamibacterales bacterium]